MRARSLTEISPADLPTELAVGFTRIRVGVDNEATYAEKLRVSRDDIAWYSANSENQTHPVKLKLANQWGLYDMLGNVWEWCSDQAYRRYSSAAQQNPTGPTAGEGRVIRGGAWDSCVFRADLNTDSDAT